MNVNENDFFRQATLRLCSTLNKDLAMQRLMEYLRNFIPADGLLMGYYDPELNIGQLLAGIWPEDWKWLSNTMTFPAELSAWMRDHLSRAPETKVINDVNELDPAMRKVFNFIFPQRFSTITLDLELDNERLGVFLVYAREKHRFTEYHAHLIDLLHEPMAIAFSNILQYQEISRLRDLLADDNRYLHRQLLELTGDTIIGADFGLKDVMAAVRQIAPLNIPVLLLGETGVGKEVLANALHNSSSRRDQPFIKVNCGAIPESLIDSELFGHEKGAFTGAVSRKRGRFERAHTGTIFLDEIGELPLAAQTRLLRVVQFHEIERVGGTEIVNTDVRIISATNRNLENMVADGKFREDLYYRLHVFPITIPPLRKRKEDIPALVNHFIERKSHEIKTGHQVRLAPGALERLQAYDWPGNVRELENLVEREMIQGLIKGQSETLGFKTINQMPSAPATGLDGVSPLENNPGDIPPLDDVMARHIQKALEYTNGKVEGKGGAAEILGLHPSTLRGRMRKLEIPFGRST